MNNFYASVECMKNPQLREFPLAVCGSIEERHGIVLAKNYKAKAFGVKTGEAVFQAKNKCPELVVVEPHYEDYMKYSRLAKRIYSDYTDKIEGMGIDENWLDVSGSMKSIEEAGALALEIKERIKFELGVTISVGVSFNKVFAKLGSDMKKPDAVTVIAADSFREQIWHLPCSDLLGVGYRTAKAFARIGIFTIGQLALYPEEALLRKFGIIGVKLGQFARGEDDSPVANQNYVFPAKSVGNGITFLQDLEENREVFVMILELCGEISHKLYVLGRRAGGISLCVRDRELQTSIRQKKLKIPQRSATELAKEAYSLFISSYDWHLPIRTITVAAIDLCPEDSLSQLDLFTNAEKIEKLERLEDTLEGIRNRFGRNIVKNACTLKLSKMPEPHPEIIMPHSGF